MRRQLLTAFLVLVTMTALLGVAYPLLVTGVAQAAFPTQANGSIVEVDGTPVASSLIGQSFTGAEWFHGRPSATGYDAEASGAANLGPTSRTLLDQVRAAVAAYRTENHLSAQVPVPVDAVTSSGSGLDPEISIANARLQAPRVAAARGVPVAKVLALVARHTTHRPLGILGDPGVNVVLLNLDLRTLAP